MDEFGVSISDIVIVIVNESVVSLLMDINLNSFGGGGFMILFSMLGLVFVFGWWCVKLLNKVYKL